MKLKIIKKKLKIIITLFKKNRKTAKLLGDDVGYGSPLLARSPSGRRRSGRRRGQGPWKGAQEEETHPSEQMPAAHATDKRGRTPTISERKGYAADPSRIISPDYTASCLGKRSRSPSPSMVFRPILKDYLIEHDSSEYYGTTKLEQRSRSPSPTTSLQNLASQRFFRPCSRATGSAAAAALATGNF